MCARALSRYNRDATNKITGKHLVEARTNKSPHGFSFGRPRAEQHDTSMRGCRVLNEIRQTFIKSQKNALITQRGFYNDSVRGPTEIFIHDRIRIMASQPEIFGEIGWEVFMDFELQ